MATEWDSLAHQHYRNLIVTAINNQDVKWTIAELKRICDFMGNLLLNPERGKW